MADEFASKRIDIDSPVTCGEVINVASTDHTLTNTCRCLWVGGAGDVALVLACGTALTIKGVQDGTLLPVRVLSITRTGTTATNMVALW